MMKEPDKMAAITRAIVEAVGKPVIIAPVHIKSAKLISFVQKFILFLELSLADTNDTTIQVLTYSQLQS